MEKVSGKKRPFQKRDHERVRKFSDFKEMLKTASAKRPFKKITREGGVSRGDQKKTTDTIT